MIVNSGPDFYLRLIVDRATKVHSRIIPPGIPSAEVLLSELVKECPAATPAQLSRQRLDN